MAASAAAAGSQRLKADLALASCTLVWGATFVIVKNALADASPLAFIAVRFVAAAALMALIFRRVLKRTTIRESAAGACIGIFMFAGYGLQTAGLAYTSPSKAAFITGTSVVMVPVLQAMVWRVRVSPWVAAGVAAAVAGLYLLTVPAAGLARLNRGDLLVGGCAVMFAVHILVTGYFSPRYSTGALAFDQIATTALLASLGVPLAKVAHWETPHLRLTPELAAAVAVTSALATALAFTAQVWAQRHTSPTHTAILFSLEPVFAGLTSFLWLHERLAERSLAGAALILVGILLAEVRGRKPVAAESVGS
jgi:drug/metabolite transporter (DMT)-like permease